MLALARDYAEAGRETALKAAQVMRGESPSRMAFAPPSKTRKLINLQKAAGLQLVIPDSLLRDAERVAPSATP